VPERFQFTNPLTEGYLKDMKENHPGPALAKCIEKTDDLGWEIGSG
jgi:hypothetical protein